MAVVAADPDVVLVIDEDAVRLARPVGHVVVRTLAPALNELAVPDRIRARAARPCSRCRSAPVSLWARRRAAAPPRRASRRGRSHDIPRLLVELFFGQRLGQMRHPDVLLGVDEHAGDRAHDPVIGHFLRPGGVDLECRGLLPAWPVRREGRHGECKEATGPRWTRRSRTLVRRLCMREKISRQPPYELSAKRQ